MNCESKINVLNRHNKLMALSPKTSVLVSISSTFYVRIFCTRVFSLLRFWLWTNFCTKNTCVECWWNWHLGSILPTCLREAFILAEPKRSIRRWWLNCLFSLLVSASLKAAPKHVDKIDPESFYCSLFWSSSFLIYLSVCQKHLFLICDNRVHY